MEGYVVLQWYWNMLQQCSWVPFFLSLSDVRRYRERVSSRCLLALFFVGVIRFRGAGSTCWLWSVEAFWANVWVENAHNNVSLQNSIMIGTLTITFGTVIRRLGMPGQAHFHRLSCWLHRKSGTYLLYLLSRGFIYVDAWLCFNWLTELCF